MTLMQFLENLKAVNNNGRVKFSKTSIKVNQLDGKAAEAILWLGDKYPELTLGELGQILDNARWWLILLGSASRKPLKEQSISRFGCLLGTPPEADSEETDDQDANLV